MFLTWTSDELLALFTFLLVVVAVFQWRTMREHKKSLETMAASTTMAAVAARESVEAAKQSFVLSHRPRLGIRFMSATSDHGKIPTSGTCQVFNSGDTNAALDRQWFEIFIGNHLPGISPYQGKHGQPCVDMTLVPGNPVDIVFPTDGPRAINDSEYCALGNHREFVKKHPIENPTEPDHLFVIGWISYHDEMMQLHITGFCQRYNFRTERFEGVTDPDYAYGDK